MPRFVLLFHQCPRDDARPSHWDLMFEAEGVLRTWALGQLPRDWQVAHRDTARACGACPPLAAGNTVDAQELADHRTAYLDYQGPISGERGTVTRVAGGTFETRSQTPDRWEITVTGRDFSGRVVLRRVERGGRSWQISFQPEAMLG